MAKGVDSLAFNLNGLVRESPKVLSMTALSPRCCSSLPSSALVRRTPTRAAKGAEGDPRGLRQTQGRPACGADAFLGVGS